jgi:hypothetical protein
MTREPPRPFPSVGEGIAVAGRQGHLVRISFPARVIRKL